MTNTQVIEAALRLLNILTEVETASAEQAASALTSMNNLFAMWAADGLNIGYVQQSDVDATSPIDAESLQAAIYNLAVALAPEYGAPIRPDVVGLAEAGYKRVLRESLKDSMVESRLDHMPMGEGHCGTFDITVG